MDHFSDDLIKIYPHMEKKVQSIKSFLLARNLSFDEDIEFSLAMRVDGEIIATASIANNVLKCVAVDKNYENLGIAAKLVATLIYYAHELGRTHLFLFTKPQNKVMFEEIGFYEIARAEPDAILMENRKNGISKYLQSLTPEVVLKENAVIGSIVANCNPFTLGHLHLIKYAKANCDYLHLFILQENRSEFAPDVRFELVKQGIKGIDNIFLHKTEQYIVSDATFPSYFLKEKADKAKVSTAIDLDIFCKHIAPFLNITKRFAGEEPNSVVTQIYNDAMAQTLPKFGIEFVVIPRLTLGDNCALKDKSIISATKVRKLIKENNLEEVKKFVPKSTYDYIISNISNISQQGGN